MYDYIFFSDIYYYTSTLIGLILISITVVYPKNSKLVRYISVSFVFFLMLLLFIRPITNNMSFPDTAMYASWFNYAKQNNEIEKFKDVGFDLILLFLAKIGNLRFFFIVITTINFALIFLIGKKISKEYYYIFIVLSVVSVYSFTLITSLLRQEMALLFIIFSLLFDQKYVKYSLMIIAVLFHMSVLLLVIPIFILDIFSIRFRYLLIFWMLSSVLSYIFSGKYLQYLEFLSFFESRIHYYISENNPKTAYSTDKVFRWDFWFFSILILINIIYQIILGKIKDKRYLYIAKVLILSNSIWLYFMYSNHTNRFLILSLSLIPAIFTMQILNEKKEKINFIFAIVFFIFSVFNLILYKT